MTDLPQGWREVALGEVADITSGKTPNSLEARLAKSPRADRNIPFYKVGDMNASPKYFDVARVYLAPDEVQSLGVTLIPVGSVVFPKAGGAIATNKKRVMRTSGCIDLNCMAVLARDGLHPSFLFQFFEATNLSDLSTGSVLPQIGKKSVAQISLPLPPLAEQERIVEILEEQFSRLDSALASIKAVREKAKAFRRSLLHSAFSGELTGGTEGWREVALKDAAEVVMGQSPPSSAYNEVGAGKPFFQGKAEFGDKHPTVKKWTTEGSKHSIAGDILMSVRAPVGPTNIANVDCVIGRGLAAIRAGSLTNQTYLLWVLRSIETDIAARGVGTTFASISGGELRSTRLPLPPLAEQERIVSLLEEQFSRLDKALEVANQLEARIASERRSLLHAAFTGELTSQWRKTHV